MKRLIIDSASPTLIVLVCDNEIVLSEVSMTGNRKHATFIVKVVDEALNKAKLAIDEIDQFVVGEGPGSYTGLRAGLMVVKMFSYTLDKPLYKINSLSLLTSGYSNLVNGIIRLNSHTGFSGVTKDGKLLDEIKAIKYEDLNDNYFLLDKSTIKINVNEVFKLMVQVDDVNAFTPNYYLELNI